MQVDKHSERVLTEGMETMNARTTIPTTEMADLLNLLADVAAGFRIGVERQRRAEQLRDSIIAGTPEASRISKSFLDGRYGR